MKTLSNFDNGVLATSFTLLAKAIGFLTALLTAKYFGAGVQTDIVFFTWGAFLALSQIFQSLNSSVLLPEFVKLLDQQGPSSAMQLFNLFFTRISCLLLLCCFVLGWFRTEALQMFSGFEDSTLLEAQTLTLILIPAPVFLFAVDLCLNLIQARRNFLLAGLATLLNSITIVFCIQTFHKDLGARALATGLIAGAFLQFVFLFICLRFNGFVIRFRWKSETDLRKIKSLWVPTLLMQLSGGLGVFVCDWFATNLNAGSLSAINYGRRIHDLMPNIMIFPLVLALYPRLCQLQKPRILSARVLDMILLLESILIPCSVFAALQASGLGELLFGNTALNPSEMTILAETLALLSLSTPALISISIVTHALLSLQNPGTAKSLLQRNLLQLLVLTGLLALLTPILHSRAIPLSLSLTLLCITLPLTLKISHQHLGFANPLRHIQHIIVHLALSLIALEVAQQIALSFLVFNTTLITGAVYISLLVGGHLLIPSHLNQMLKTQFLKRGHP